MVAELYDRVFQEMVHYLLSMTHSRPEAEDIAQETFLRALANAHLFEEMSQNQGKAWLYRTAKNLFIDQCRRKGRERPEVLGEGYAEDDTTGPYVHQMLMYLPEEDRAIFYLRHFDGLNATQIGEQLGMPAATVRYRLAKCRALLREQCETQRSE